ncbi:MAG TPA: efflux RND transporter periplasmic adaptor subunit [Clostridia bacterium]|nr:efflux RND transporter periplasmic adaptor subunit [Clostridia bacterium]
MPSKPEPTTLLTLCQSAALAALFTILTGCSKPVTEKPKVQRDDAIAVTVAKVEVMDLDRTLPVVGTLHPKNEATIAAQVEGQIEKSEVDFGDKVVGGQELALIDTASYEALAKQSAAALVKAKASALNHESNLRRMLELQKSRISSASDLDSATAEAEQARAEVKAVEAAEAIAQLNLKRSRVIAPFSGTISERIANMGDYVKVGSPLFRIVEDSDLKFIVQAPERYAAQVKTNQTVQLTVDAWPDRCFEGVVYLISPSVSTTTRSFNLAALVHNPNRQLKANSFARGQLILERAVPTPVVPLEAVLNFAGVTKVFIVENEVARSRKIKTGRIKDGRQEVLEGLKPDETVVVSGITKLYENAKVKIQAPTTNAVALSQ